PSPFSPLFSFFFFSCSVLHRDLHSFPTRRSSDLGAVRGQLVGARLGPAPRRVLVGLVADHTPPRVRRQRGRRARPADPDLAVAEDRKSTRLNSSHVKISYAVFCLKKKNDKKIRKT